VKFALVIAAAVGVGGPFAFVTTLAAAGDVPWSRRDLDCSGRVSIAEWYAAGLDYGWRQATRETPGCWEVFEYKDGRSVTVWCAASPECRRAQ
jgi:hypothetical protein